MTITQFLIINLMRLSRYLFLRCGNRYGLFDVSFFLTLETERKRDNV